MTPSASPLTKGLHAAIEDLTKLCEERPQDVEAFTLLAALHARLEDAQKAVEQLARVADILQERGDKRKAAVLPWCMLAMDPDNEAALLRLAAQCDSGACGEEAVALLRDFVERKPGDQRLRAAIARYYILDDDLSGAAKYLTEPMAHDDPDALLAIAEILLRGDHFAQAQPVLKALAGRGSSYSEAIARLGCELTRHSPERGWAVIEIGLEPWVAASEWPKALPVIARYLMMVPGSVPALLRLVEGAVETGLDKAASKAQAQLADAYLEQGDGAQALAVAQDLSEREPANAAHSLRVKRAMSLLEGRRAAAHAV
jgi:tetratricopeptide (TPR) repeat protein